jgi:predicted Rossmann fold flavoprotein
MNYVKTYDVAVIGGGAAGMIAAGKAAELGKSVILVEKNKQLGVKLLITGKGRCNITNAEEKPKHMLEKYGKNGRFLYTAFAKFSNIDTIGFFENLGLDTKIERGQRVFPVSDNAKDVVNALKRYLRDNKVEILLNKTVKTVNQSKSEIENLISSMLLDSGEEIKAKNFIWATGGKSYPQTGATGDANAWLKKLDHRIVVQRPALTPIIVKERWVKDLAGLSLRNVSISLWNNKKIADFFGEALFTHNGLSGPIILDLSNYVNLEEEQTISIDFKPALDHQKLDFRIRKDFEEQQSKQFKNSLNMLLPKKLIPVIIEKSGINPEKKVAEISKNERKGLLRLLKDMRFTVAGLVGFEKAIVTSGGVHLKDIDPKSMKSKTVSNLYFAGEMIDIDGPTGGYNLQVAWSTGYLAGELN